MASSRFIKGITLLCLPLISFAQDPWAIEVISYTPGSDPATGYDLPDNALGRPTTETYADYTETEPSTVVVPVYSAWDFSELISIGEGGSIVLRMGQAITDDPTHPYGTDLLIFSYTFINGAGLYDQVIQDPTLYTLPDSATIALYTDGKWGKVSLSADGSTWYDFPSQFDLPRLLPTLGRVWTGSDWGQFTDPTLPPDPALTLSELAGMNLAELCRRYRGGAGGAGLDLADLIPPATGSLPTSFSYVRISVPDDGDENTNYRIEIDAVTVVAPASAYTRWTQEHFNWVEAPELENPSADPEEDLFTNWQEFARGGDPLVTDLSLWTPEITLSQSVLSYTLPQSAEEAPWEIEMTALLGEESNWQALSPQPTPTDLWSGDDIEREVTLPIPSEDAPQFFRLHLQDPE
ncbi:hypothetical protein P3T73_15760 [Kiritimatiellota bacterium B12222]|nr:hypothetical protein P3T73_15760 [Kiritimatiellota bacterium B12222]